MNCNIKIGLMYWTFELMTSKFVTYRIFICGVKKYDIMMSKLKLRSKLPLNEKFLNKIH